MPEECSLSSASSRSADLHLAPCACATPYISPLQVSTVVVAVYVGPYACMHSLSGVTPDDAYVAEEGRLPSPNFGTQADQDWEGGQLWQRLQACQVCVALLSNAT